MFVFYRFKFDIKIYGKSQMKDFDDILKISGADSIVIRKFWIVKKYIYYKLFANHSSINLK